MISQRVGGDSPKYTKPEDILYYAKIRAAAATGQSRVIENGCPEHAVYLMRKMFEYAKDKIRIFSGSLAREKENFNKEVVRVFADEDLIASIVAFLRPQGRRLEIVVADGVDGGDEGHPLLWRLKNEAIEGAFRVGRLNAVGRRLLTAETGGHFFVMDEQGYRLETDDMQVKAYASFGDCEAARILAKFFDANLRPNSDMIMQSARQGFGYAGLE